MRRRILIIHNRYRVPGGEDKAVDREIALLRHAGHEVELLEDRSSDHLSPLKQAATALHLARSPKADHRVGTAIDRFRPSVVHVHNTFPHFSPGIFSTIRAKGIPSVATLHNFRILCANGLLLRDGRPCEKCVTGSPWWGAIHGCYRESQLLSLPMSHMIATHHERGTWRNDVTEFVVLSEFSRALFQKAGLSHLNIKPNFAIDRGWAKETSSGHALWVGRLSEEKGLSTLLRAWEKVGFPLRIIGDGPLRDKMRNLPSHVTWLGSLSEEEVQKEMLGARFLVVSSECYENFPLVIAEAYSAGTPVLASAVGSLRELIAPEQTGLHFSPGDPADLAAKARLLFTSAPTMRLQARSKWELQFSEGVNLKILESIYDKAASSAQRS